MEYYPLIKTVHISTVIISLSLFVLRIILLLLRSTKLKTKTLRILPHLNDSVLLFSAIALLIIGSITPDSHNPWIIAKIVAMIIYIGIGFAVFRGKLNNKNIIVLVIIALIIYSYIAHTALTKTIYPFVY